MKRLNEVKNKIFSKLKGIFLIAFMLFSIPLYSQDYYWENPRNIINTESIFPNTINTNQYSYIFWQDVDVKKQEIYLSCRVYPLQENITNKEKLKYQDNLRFAGPYSYSGDMPDIFSVTVNDEGLIVLAVSANNNKLEIFISDDNCKSFSQHKIKSDLNMNAPRIYKTYDGKIRLFASVVINDSFHIYYADSVNGKNWSDFIEFTPSANIQNSFIPFLIDNGDSDIVVFQGQYRSDVIQRFSYQLFSSYTMDGGASWSEPILLTGQNSFPSSQTKNFANFANQRPYLYNYKNTIYMAWERMENTSANIWIAEISKNGLIPRTSFVLADSANSNRPIFFEYKDKLFVSWFDIRTSRESLYMAEQNGLDWETYTILENENSNMFAFPLIIRDFSQNEQLSFVWQQVRRNKNNISILNPDTTVLPPTVIPKSYKLGKRSRSQNVEYTITMPKDSSGISGYSYSWGKENTQEPAEELQYFPKDRTIKLKAEEDGIYKLLVKVRDRAGNWSQVQEVSYHRDITPPLPPQIDIINNDKYGMIDSNTFRLNWKASQSEDVASYNYELTYLGGIPSSLKVNKTHKIKLKDEEVFEIIENLHKKYASHLEKEKYIKANNSTTALRTKNYYNRANGVYLLSVSAVDEVGNIGKCSHQLIILNKYLPQTYIQSLESGKNELSQTELIIHGGGFTYEGTISKIYIDKDGKAPYDLELVKDKDFKVRSNSKISNISIGTELEEGNYKIGLLHTDRGLYFSGNIFKKEQSGTLKIQSEYVYKNKFSPIQFISKYSITIGAIFVIIIVLLVLSIIYTLILVFAQIHKEKIDAVSQINALLTGDIMPSEKRERMKSKERRHSLKIKLVAFTVVLVAVVVMFVTFKNGRDLISTQEETLGNSLQNRIDVLTESIALGTKNFLPIENDLELGALPSQKEAVLEAKYVTIVGKKRSTLNVEDNSLTYVWASNDPDIQEKVDKIGEYGVLQGESKVIDETILQIVQKMENVNNVAKSQVKTISEEISKFSNENTALALNRDEESIERRAELSELTTNLRNELDFTLSQLANEYSKSYPIFEKNLRDPQTTDYLFYRPVLYRSGSSNNYLHGVIIIEVSIQTLIDALNQEINEILISAVVLALIAVLLGAFGALFLATLIVKPIKQLENHLMEVGSLMTKSVRERQRLEKKHINIKSKDEIGHLGDVVNKMTLSAGQAAYEEFLQLDGKAVQERFIPLEDGVGGRKLPIAKFTEEKLDVFAYYKGDSAVSGDYFDYKRLDDKWYVFIKCDISGHGVPAALLVSVIATKFKDFYYFSKWNFAKNGINLKTFVSTVNDFIFELGTKGKFSTINISLYNKETGELYVCNAGDNKVHIMDSKTKRLREVTLSNTPTAGGISTDLVEMSGGYKVEKLTLNHGDILYLYTDGIDEAERLIRDKNFLVKQSVKESVRIDRKTGKEEKITQTLEEKEQFGLERVTQIIEKVVNKEKFLLTKEDNPIKSEILEFDFTNASGTIEETIIALAAIERVFRMVKTPTVREDDEIEVELLIDDFLKKHFNLYSKYCIPVRSQEDIQEKKKGRKNKKIEAEVDTRKIAEDPNVTRYSYVIEDKQADDITLIAIKRI